MQLDEYKLVFENQSIGEASLYIAVKETKLHLYLIQKDGSEKHIFRLNKKSLKIKGMNVGENPYQWDVPTPKSLLKMKN